jgi:rSAM/selenodomain-associated transferase 1
MAWSLPRNGVLGIFGTRPEPGKVQTLLAGELGPERAAALHEAMLFDLLDLWDSPGVLAPGGRKVLAYAPGSDETGRWFDSRVPEGFALQPQAEGDPGRRLAEFFAGEFEAGAERVVAVGSDAPTLDPSFVVSAFLALEGRDVVLGPATSGGYYLAGCRGAVAPIFSGIDWDTPDVLAQTIDRLDGTGLSVAVLPPWYTIEDEADVRMLRGHLRAMRRSGMDPMLARTEAWFEQAGT